jgi:DNA sulfur modification protein DndE
MKPPLENIRVSARSREILINLKRKTGIANWNIICRWAFCDSLSNPNRPVAAIGSAESNVEMSWETFAGEFAEVLLAVFNKRAAQDGLSQEKHDRATYFRSHLERGISQLQNAKNLSDLFVKATTKTTPSKNSVGSQIAI